MTRQLPKHLQLVVSDERSAVSGGTSTITTRPATDETGRSFGMFEEERYSIRVPRVLTSRLGEITANLTWLIPSKGTQRKRVYSHSFTLVFHEPVVGILGLPVGDVAIQRLKETSFTHVTIERLSRDLQRRQTPPKGIPSSAHNESAFVITWFVANGADSQDIARASRRTVVDSVNDELSILSWLLENGLEGLYSIQHLTSYHLLPMRDIDRHRHDDIVRCLLDTSGRPELTYPTTSFARWRLLQRLGFVHNHTPKASEILDRMAIGQKAKPSAGDLGITRPTHGRVAVDGTSLYLVFDTPDGELIAKADDSAQLMVERLKTDPKGRAQLIGYEAFSDSPGFRPIPWGEALAWIKRQQQAKYPPRLSPPEREFFYCSVSLSTSSNMFFNFFSLRG